MREQVLSTVSTVVNKTPSYTENVGILLLNQF